MTTYSTVIATRNRPEALALSLPLHLAQSRLPERIIVVDGSDDPSANAALVARVAATSPIPLSHQPSPPGASLQRNAGIDQVTSDVTFLPDDDSLVLPGALDAMMRIYDRDAAGRIGGVAATETRRRPSDPGARAAPEAAPAYRMRRSDRLKALIAPTRARIEDRLVPDPMKLAAHRLMARLPAPEPWLAEEDAARVEWMTGFRMSFRTPVIRAVGFNEGLGRYALFEDVDAGLGVLRTHALVTTSRALIYHHKAPEDRAGGRQLGALHVLNRAYVTLRHAPLDGRLRAAILRHARYKALQYRLEPGDFGRDRFAGAQAAIAALPELMAAAPGALDAAYLRLRPAVLAGEA